MSAVSVWGAGGLSRPSGSTHIMRTAGIPCQHTKSRSIPSTDGGQPQLLTDYASTRLLLQILFCIASVVLGFRTSQEISLVLLQFRFMENSLNLKWFDQNSRESSDQNILPGFSDDALMVHEIAFDRLHYPVSQLVPEPLVYSGSSNSSNESSSTGIQVGRHKMLIREWPHPDPKEMMKAFNLIARVQLEQKRLQGVYKDLKPVIVITPTCARMFQALHLTGLMHTMSLVRGPVTWIVIEAGGRSKGTADLLTQALVQCSAFRIS